MTKVRLLIVLGILQLLGAVMAQLVGVPSVRVPAAEAVTLDWNRNGWDETAAREAASQQADPPELMISGATQGSAGAKAFLWTFAQQINGGQHFPTYRQETGDCVSFGAANAILYVQAVQQGLHGFHEEFHPVFQPWIYGVSRTAKDIGNKKLGRSAGSVGRWAAETVKKYGVLAADAEGVPDYSGRLADDWGFKGVPDQYFPLAKDFTVNAVALVKNYEAARDALANGYPVTVASNVGFKMQPVLHDGKRFGVQSGSWNHQMVFIGVDDTCTCPDGSQGALYILNSWGASAHGTPAGDEPPGGFWVSRKVAERMLGQGDSWAFSAFTGFPAQDLDFRVFTSGEDAPELDLPEPPPAERAVCELAGVSADTCQHLTWGLGLAGAATFLLVPRNKKSLRRTRLSA